MPTMRVTVIVVIVPLLAACASSGLYNMSDAWCATHLSASEARCPEHQESVAVNNKERIVNNVVHPNH